MPGLLNSCWAALALCAVLYHLRSKPPCVPALRLQRALALACVLALLFPVISADDDVLQQQVASEVNAFSGIKAPADPHKCKSRVAAVFAAVIVSRVLMSTVDDTVDFVPPVYRTLKSQTTGDRSPPQI